MPFIPTRSVSITFSYPYFKLTFIDTAAILEPGEQNCGQITYDISNDFGFNFAGMAIANCTRLWCNGMDFVQIFRKFPDV